MRYLFKSPSRIFNVNEKEILRISIEKYSLYTKKSGILGKNNIMFEKKPFEKTYVRKNYLFLRKNKIRLKFFLKILKWNKVCVRKKKLEKK